MAERKKGLLAGAAIGMVLLLPGSPFAQETLSGGDARWGTIGSPEGVDAREPPAAALAAIAPASTVKSAQYSSGGIGLRNLGTGTLHISGATPPVKAAFLYWAVITTGPAPPADKSVRLTRTFPAGGRAVMLTGTLLGTGASPCWPGNTISVFRAAVPVADVSGNGSYEVAFVKAGASGSTKGEDPWLAAVQPLVEGASLVVVGTGTATVQIFDKGLAGRTFGTRTNPETFSYSLSLASATTGRQVLFENIGADGQIGTSRTAGIVSRNQPYLAAKATQINGQLVAGPYNAQFIDFDSDWNGNAAAPLPRLWDDVGHDITAVAPAGTRTLNVQVTTQGDCLTPVANVVAAF